MTISIVKPQLIHVDDIARICAEGWNIKRNVPKTKYSLLVSPGKSFRMYKLVPTPI